MSVDSISSAMFANKNPSVADSFAKASITANALRLPLAPANYEKVGKLYDALNVILAKNGSNCSENGKLDSACEQTIDAFVTYAFSDGKTELSEADYKKLIDARLDLSPGIVSLSLSNIGDYICAKGGRNEGPLTREKLKAHLTLLASQRSEQKNGISVAEDPFDSKKTTVSPSGWGYGKLQPVTIEGDDTIPEKEPVTNEQRKESKQEFMRRMEKEDPEAFKMIREAKTLKTALDINETEINPVPPRP